MGAISDLIHRMNSQDVAPVAHAENGGATPKPAPTLGVAPVAPVACVKGSVQRQPRWPAVWSVRVGGKSLTMVDFDHQPEDEIERHLRARFGSRLEGFELKHGGKSAVAGGRR